MDLALQAYAPVFTPGTYMAMGASHYVFFKEIPIGSEYTMEAKVGGWGDKWIYIVTEYIIYPKKSSNSKSHAPTPSPPSDTVNPILTSAPAPSRNDTPEPSTSKQGSADLLKKATYRARQPRADGGVVCCLAINEYCFKIGRVTVPPVCLFPRVLTFSRKKTLTDLAYSKLVLPSLARLGGTAARNRHDTQAQGLGKILLTRRMERGPQSR